MPSPVYMLAAALLVTGCASTRLAHTPGEISRDTNGRPVWSLIDPSVPATARP